MAKAFKPSFSQAYHVSIFSARNGPCLESFNPLFWVVTVILTSFATQIYNNFSASGFLLQSDNTHQMRIKPCISLIEPSELPEILYSSRNIPLKGVGAFNVNRPHNISGKANITANPVQFTNQTTQEKKQCG